MITGPPGAIDEILAEQRKACVPGRSRYHTHCSANSQAQRSSRKLRHRRSAQRSAPNPLWYAAHPPLVSPPAGRLPRRRGTPRRRAPAGRRRRRRGRGRTGGRRAGAASAARRGRCAASPLLLRPRGRFSVCAACLPASSETPQLNCFRARAHRAASDCGPQAFPLVVTLHVLHEQGDETLLSGARAAAQQPWPFPLALASPPHLQLNK